MNPRADRPRLRQASVSSTRGLSVSLPTSRGEMGVRRHRPDYLLLLLVLMLLAVGLVVIYSVSPAIAAQVGEGVNQNYFMYRQLLFLFLGLAVFMATSLLPIKFWRLFQPYLIGFAIVSFLLLFVPALSLTHGGATRWVHIGPLTYQPVEILKFGLIFYLAGGLAERMKRQTLNELATIKWFLLIVGLVGLEIVIIQKDLGSMVPIIGIMLTMLYLSGVRLRRLAQVFAALVAAGVMSIAVAPHRIDRVVTFLGNSDSKEGGYHINQALIGIGSGGLVGRGLGNSIQAYGYLPEAANDSIFAILAEKFGFVGVMTLMVLYGYLLARMYKIVARAPNSYLRLIAAAIFSWISIQAFVNVGAMLGLLPLTGITLPFLSFGGTSLITTLAASGVMFNMSRYTVLGRLSSATGSAGGLKSRREHEDSASWRRLGRPRHAA